MPNLLLEGYSYNVLRILASVGQGDVLLQNLAQIDADVALLTASIRYYDGSQIF